jgi:hypothetical protein
MWMKICNKEIDATAKLTTREPQVAHSLFAPRWME